MHFPDNNASLPPTVQRLLVWHQGALGDVLVAGAALQAVADQYPSARFTLVGGPEPLGLLAGALPVEQVLSGQSALWLDLYQEHGPLTDRLVQFLGRFDLALVFTPQEQIGFLRRWRQTPIPQVGWIPSFPTGARIPVAQLQAQRLQRLGFTAPCRPFRLVLPDRERQAARIWLQSQDPGAGPLVALAPGSGHCLKNWPRSNFITLARRLQEEHQAQVWWILGPAEEAWRRELEESLGGGGLRCLERLPLRQLAAILAEFQLYVGNDSGVTHLAGALDQPRVAAIFGPSDPVIWAPAGATVIAADLPCSPCARGRQIPCPENLCLAALPPEQVLATVQHLLSA